MLPTRPLQIIACGHTQPFLFLFFSLAMVWGKVEAQDQNYFTIRGQILDQQNSTPLAFAHLSLSNGRIGTTSNEDGFFILRLPLQFQQDSIKVSYLGYQSKIVGLLGPGSKPLKIKLKLAGIELREIVVRPNDVDPVMLVKSMLSKLKHNYPQKPKNSTKISPLNLVVMRSLHNGCQ